MKLFLWFVRSACFYLPPWPAGVPGPPLLGASVAHLYVGLWSFRWTRLQWNDSSSQIAEDARPLLRLSAWPPQVPGLPALMNSDNTHRPVTGGRQKTAACGLLSWLALHTEFGQPYKRTNLHGGSPQNSRKKRRDEEIPLSTARWRCSARFCFHTNTCAAAAFCLLSELIFYYFLQNI